MDPTTRRERIASALTSAGLRFGWRGGAEPVATLSVQGPGTPMLELTARHTDEVFQWIAHDVLPGGADAQRLADLDAFSQDWALGRATYVEARGAWDLSLGLYAPDAPVPPAMLHEALRQLAEGRAALAAGGAPPVSPAKLPSEVMPAVARGLAEAGLQPTAAHGGELQRLRLRLDRHLLQVDCFETGGLLVFRAVPLGVPRVAPTEPLLRRLHALASRLDLGGVGLSYELGLPVGYLAHPLAGFAPTPAALRWSAERAASWAEAAQGVLS